MGDYGLSSTSFFTSSGTVFPDLSIAGFQMFELQEGEAWILEKGSYWASEGTVRLTLTREPVVTLFWAGEGLINFQSHVAGPGKVVLNCHGPVTKSN